MGLPEFLHDVLKVEEFPWAEFPHQVALHVSCSAIRGLYEQAMSERPNDPWFSKPTRNCRLVAIHRLFAYAADQDPRHAQLCRRVLNIPLKKTTSNSPAGGPGP